MKVIVKTIGGYEGPSRTLWEGDLAVIPRKGDYISENYDNASVIVHDVTYMLKEGEVVIRVTG